MQYKKLFFHPFFEFIKDSDQFCVSKFWENVQFFSHSIFFFQTIVIKIVLFLIARKISVMNFSLIKFQGHHVSETVKRNFIKLNSVILLFCLRNLTYLRFSVHIKVLLYISILNYIGFESPLYLCTKFKH